MVCCIWCATHGLLYMVCYIWCAAHGVLHMVCYTRLAAYGVLHMVCYIWCATFGMLHKVSRQTIENLTYQNQRTVNIHTHTHTHTHTHQAPSTRHIVCLWCPRRRTFGIRTRLKLNENVMASFQVKHPVVLYDQYMWHKIIRLYSNTQLSVYWKYWLYFWLHVSAYIPWIF
jgi:hypothetical protein